MGKTKIVEYKAFFKQLRARALFTLYSAKAQPRIESGFFCEDYLRPGVEQLTCGLFLLFANQF